MRKLVVWVIILALVITPGYWVYSGHIPGWVLKTPVGTYLDDWSWQLNTALALRQGEKPETTVEAFYGALQDGDYYKVETFISPAAIEYLNGDLLQGTAIQVDKYEVAEVKIRKNMAKVKTKINGSQYQFFTLFKEGGKWLVSEYGNLVGEFLD